MRSDSLPVTHARDLPSKLSSVFFSNISNNLLKCVLGEYANNTIEYPSVFQRIVGILQIHLTQEIRFIV